MIKLKYDCWEKITVNVFEKLTNAVECANVTGYEDIDLLNKQVAIISVLADVDEDSIAELTTNEFSRLVKETEFLDNPPKKNIINNRAMKNTTTPKKKLNVSFSEELEYSRN